MKILYKNNDRKIYSFANEGVLILLIGEGKNQREKAIDNHQEIKKILSLIQNKKNDLINQYIDEQAVPKENFESTDKAYERIFNFSS